MHIYAFSGQRVKYLAIVCEANVQHMLLVELCTCGMPACSLAQTKELAIATKQVIACLHHDHAT